MENVLYVLAIISMVVFVVSKVYSMYTSMEYKKDRKIRNEERTRVRLDQVERFQHKLERRMEEDD